jgi:hypothetical protein
MYICKLHWNHDNNESKDWTGKSTASTVFQPQNTGKKTASSMFQPQGFLNSSVNDRLELDDQTVDEDWEKALRMTLELEQNDEKGGFFQKTDGMQQMSFDNVNIRQSSFFGDGNFQPQQQYVAQNSFFGTACRNFTLNCLNFTLNCTPGLEVPAGASFFGDVSSSSALLEELESPEDETWRRK